ncbi:hypothetical protein MVEN_00814700 [Mycena venus]|uniref:Beta-lactamase-related domain-containing protein n=1 Tax=Mycena venus TaxID=2733690 RepID=A0A8H6YAZ2_9AGAR|nr:hypothetical protein MVEN_00814700 [Mycena venus]
MVSPSPLASQKDTFDRILSDAVVSKSTAALFFGVTTVDGPIYNGTAGKKLVDDPASQSIDEDTLYWLCSQTKLITTIAGLQLIERSKITLDTLVETVLPELADPVLVTGYDETGSVRTTTPAKGKMTFGQLLNHSSGLDYWVDGTTPSNDLPRAYTYRYKDGEDVSTFFKILKGSLPGVPLKFEPGTDFGYGFSTDCVGFIVERLSGKTLEQYFQDHIFEPLGITSASFYLTPLLKDRLLPLSFRTKSGDIERWKGPSVIEQDPTRVRVHFGGVGLYASQKDYLTVLRHLLQIIGTYIYSCGIDFAYPHPVMNVKFCIRIAAGRATAPILSRASVDSMFAPTLTSTGTASVRDFVHLLHPLLKLPAAGAQFGCGLFVNTVDVPGKRRAGSGAWDGYATTSFFVDPRSGVAAVFATQLLPMGDATHEQMYDALERELYAGFEARL